MDHDRLNRFSSTYPTYSRSTYLYSGSSLVERRMKITRARRTSAPIGPNAMLIPANRWAGGRAFSCMAAGSTSVSRLDRCDHKKMPGLRSIAARTRSTWDSS